MTSETSGNIDKRWLSDALFCFSGIPLIVRVKQRNPYNPLEWLRAYPLKHLLEDLRMDVSQYLAIYEQQLGQLERLGIALPARDYVHMDVEDKNGVRPMLYMVTAHIEGEPLGPLGGNSLSSQALAARTQLKQVLQEHRDTLEAENQTYCLADVWHPGQFVYGHQPGETVDRLYLVDIDPLLCTKDLSIYSWWSEIQPTLDSWN